MLPNPLIAFFLLNENYHLEHHLFPEIPSYHLPRLHQLIWPKLPRAVSGHSYLAFLATFFRATPRMDETPIGLVIRESARNERDNRQFGVVCRLRPGVPALPSGADAGSARSKSASCMRFFERIGERVRTRHGFASIRTARQFQQRIPFAITMASGRT